MKITRSTFYKKLFFLTTFLSSLYLFGQSKPGGTSLDVELWLKADQLNLANNTDVTTWQNLSSYTNRDFVKNGTNAVPTFQYAGMNYNPTLNFGSVPNTKLVGPTNITDVNKEYYVYIVSRNNSTTWATMLAFNEERYNSYGWSSSVISPWQYTTGGNQVATNGSGKNYSISAAFVPNVGSKNAYQYINGIETKFAANTSRAFSTSTTKKMTIGNTDLNTTYSFYGDISEIIVLSAPKGSSTPNYTDLAKVNSYLSFKYGITLPTASQVNYFNSAGEVIWNRANNIGYENNIIGLIRDDNSSINQKQAISLDDDTFTLFLNELKILNKDNTGIIADDKSYLILGSNSQNGTTNYLKSKELVYSNGNALADNVYQRSNRMLKVSTEGTFSNVNLKLSNDFSKAKYLLVSKNLDFNETETRLYPVVNGIAQDLKLENNDYISFISVNEIPGGTNLTTELWLKADDLDLNDEDNVTTWVDQSIFNRDFSRYTTNPVPGFTTNGLNFNPAINIGSDANTKLVGPNNITDPTKEYYVYYVSETNSTNATAQTVLSFDQELNNSYGWRYATTTNNAWTYVNSGNQEGDGTGKKFGINTVFAPNVANVTANSARTVIYMDGVKKEINTTQAFDVTNATRMSIGTDNLTNGYPFFGNISEIIVLSKDKGTSGLPLDTDVNKVNSYLALKYGITLHGTTNPNYYNSSGDIIWNGEANSTYKNAIFGIGRDDLTGLNQKQAKSSDTGAFTIHLSDLSNLNRQNTGNISSNKSFLILGSNSANGNIDYVKPKDTGYLNGKLDQDIAKRYARTLKVQKTGIGVGMVNLTLSNQFTYSPYVLVSKNSEFPEDETLIYPVINGIAKNITLENNDFITFATGKLVPGGTTLETELWLRADFLSAKNDDNVNAWFDVSNYGRNFTQGGSDPVPTYNVTGLNYNPSLSFANSKLVGPTNIINSTKEYYVYYVSETDDSGYNTVFDFDATTGAHYNGRIGWNSNHPWYYDDSANRNYNTYTGQPYGINVIYTPNKTTSTSYIYTNAKSSLIENTNTTMPVSNSNLMVVGNGSTRTTGYTPLIGRISEIIVLSRDKTVGNSIPFTNDIEKVNSYLALKYGITLDKASQPKYYNSKGEVIWDGTSSEYTEYTQDLLAIGRDDLTGYYQKQATSLNQNSVTLYLNKLAKSNQENDSQIELIDGQKERYIILGSNGGNEIKNYEVIASFKNGSLSNGTYQRFSRVLKVSNQTNLNPENLNLKVANELISSTHVIVSSSETFEQSNTRIYPVINGFTEDLTLNDGEYIGFITRPTPGGLTNLRREIWLIGDEIRSSSIKEDQDSIQFDIDKVTFWSNIADDSNNFINTNKKLFYPSYNKNSMNYHSSVDFNYIEKDDGGPATPEDNYYRQLISSKDFTPDTNRSYFTIYISRLDPETQTQNTNYQSVLSLNDGGYNVFGWRSKARAWLRVDGNDNTDNVINNKKTYGITVNIMPNDGSTASSLYLNGFNNNNTINKTLGTATGKSILGGYKTNNSAENFAGEILEVLVVSKDGKGQTLSVDELAKINTYYSLKYGVSLEGGQSNYILTNGTEVYNSSSTDYTTYDKDVFGIVRDNQVNLYQKQSISTESNLVSVYLGNLAETNDENTSDLLANNEALVFGTTGDVGGRTAYNYSSDPNANLPKAFKNYTLGSTTNEATGVTTFEKLSFISNYVLRARVTRADGSKEMTVNFAPNVGQWLLVSSVDATFKPSETSIYKIKDGIVKGITIKDGDYIGFAAYQEAPGGVSDKLTMWLNASELETVQLNDQNEILSWADYSGNGIIYKKRPENNASALFVKSDKRSNYHPTPLFRKWQDYLITDKSAMFMKSPDNTTLYSVVNHNFSAANRSYFIGFGAQKIGTNARRPSFGVYSDGDVGRARIGSTGLTNSTAKLFNPGATMIAGYSWLRGSNIMFDFDNNTQTIAHTAKNSVMNAQGMLGLGSSSTNYYLQGTMPEVIAYEKQLSKEDREKVNSYLGLKYAITLRSNVFNTSGSTTSASNFNYKLSNDVSVWDGTDDTHKVFHNNVASVVRNDDSKLYNAQSSSTDIGSIIHMGVGESLGVDGQLGKIVNDYSALTWGHNNGSFALEKNIGCGNFSTAINGRIWLVDKVNFDQEIILRTDGALGENASGFPYGANYQVYLLVADNAEDLRDQKWDQVIPMTYIDGAHQLNYKFTDKYTYFTFGGKSTGTCTSCDFEGEKSLKFNKSTWPTRGDKGPNTFNLGNNFNVEVSVEDSNPASLRNKYPRFSSKNTLRERRKGTDAITTSIKFFDDNGGKISSAAHFNLFDLDRAGYKLDDVQVVGYCGGSEINPVIGYTYKYPERSRYTIEGLGKTLGKAPGVRYNGGSGYTNARAIAYVEFDTPVDEIKIIYKTKNVRNSNSTQEIGIGELSFYCVAPLPAPNEDGLIFTKQASSEVLLCETVDYTFRVVNTNCGDKEFTLEDTLPENMLWIEDSFSVIQPNLVITPEDPDNPDNSYVPYTDLKIITDETTGRQKLIVTGLKAPGGGNTFTIKASAVFADNAIADDYLNSASITYDRIVGSTTTPVSLESTDRLTGEVKSKTVALASIRPKRITTEFSLSAGTCFSLGKEIIATLKIDNPNEYAINDLVLDFGFNIEGVSYVANSLYSRTIELSTNNIDLTDVADGNVAIEGFNLPSGSNTITLKFKTSDNPADYVLKVDPLDPNNTSTFEYENLDFSYDLFSESEVECMESTTAFTSGDIELTYCDFCVKQPIGGTPFDSTTGISTLKNQFNGWPENVPNGFLVLEAGKRGMVLTRVNPKDIKDPVIGMIIYNTEEKCISIYNGIGWKCIERACND